jgi:hypothetical protein
MAESPWTPSDVDNDLESVKLWAFIVRVFAFALVRRWAFRRDNEITGSSQVGEQVTAATLVSIRDA